ncbi:cholecystokinin receptor-like isoform X1 [Ciona intestinalis]
MMDTEINVTSAPYTHARFTCYGTTLVEMRGSFEIFHNSTVSYESNFSQLSEKEVASICLYMIVFCMAIVGNILVVVTLALNPRMRTVTNCFLLSLAVSDLLLAVCCMPVSLVGQILKRFIFGEVLCKAIPYFMAASVSVSTFTLLALSLERYSSICHPLKSRVWQTRKHAIKVICGIWISSFILVSPTLVFSNLSNIPIVKIGRCSPACRMSFPNRIANQAWYLFLLVSMFCIPGVVMVMTYTKICWDILNRFKLDSSFRNTAGGRLGSSSDYVPAATSNGDGICVSSPRLPCDSKIMGSPSMVNSPANARANKEFLQPSAITMLVKSSECNTSPFLLRSKREQNDRANRALARWKAKKRVIQMFIVIVVLYFVCWTPLYVINAWRAFEPKRAMFALEGSIHIVHLLSYISTCVNPIVYCFMNKRFRDSFLYVFLCCASTSCATKFHQERWKDRKFGTIGLQSTKTSRFSSRSRLSERCHKLRHEMELKERKTSATAT